MPVLHYLHSHKRLFLLWLMTLLFCSLRFTNFSVQTNVYGCGETAKKECVTTHDGLNSFMMQKRQMLPAGAVFSDKTGERLGSSRLVRLISTNGSKPGRTLGRWTSSNSFHLSNLYALLLRRSEIGLQAWAASPRFYYVIALRRILC